MELSLIGNVVPQTPSGAAFPFFLASSFLITRTQKRSIASVSVSLTTNAKVKLLLGELNGTQGEGSFPASKKESPAFDTDYTQVVVSDTRDRIFPVCNDRGIGYDPPKGGAREAWGLK